MDSIESAFSMYRANKKTTSKRNKKKMTKPISSKPLPRSKNENDIINITQKVQRVQKKKVKDNKSTINKKKHKKEKLRKVTWRTESIVSFTEEPNDHEDSVNEDIPCLISLPNNNQQDNADELNSNSNHDGPEFDPVITNSAEEGLKVFKWMIAPYQFNEFFKTFWEKKPLHIARNKPNYYRNVISTPGIDNMLRTENVQYTKNVDITSYIRGKKQTHNPEGRAHPHSVWDFYLNGCSVRLLNPHTYISKLQLLSATLQEYFNSFIGLNAYLTPPDTQGFAPHYVDFEAFILQAEGKKRWRIYKPRNENETLPRVPSKNFSEEEIGEPILEVTLSAGDLLYFPRGYIHQGVTIDGEHSLHVTISMYQNRSWADLFEKMIPAALQIAIKENKEFRQGLPFDIHKNYGLIYSDKCTLRKIAIEEIIKNLFYKINNYLPMDEAVDQMCKNYQHDALPPVLTEAEKACTVYGNTDVMIENGKVTNRVEIGLNTKVRLLRKNILRMVLEDTIKLYYYTENSLEYHGNELPYLEIESDLAPAIETLIVSYPDYTSVKDLGGQNEMDKIQVADILWGRGLIMTEHPLEIIFDD